MSRQLKAYIREFLLTEIGRTTAKRKLRVFDFDDTLAKTHSLVHVTSVRGEKFDITPGEYAVYEKQPGDVFDYSDFDKLIDPETIKWTAKILQSIISSGGEVVILTARAKEEPVMQFLQDAGIPLIPIIALGNSDPQLKADYIAGRIESDNIDYVEFFDDSYKNIEAVRLLQTQYPNTKIVVRHVTQGD